MQRQHFVDAESIDPARILVHFSRSVEVRGSAKGMSNHGSSPIRQCTAQKRRGIYRLLSTLEYFDIVLIQKRRLTCVNNGYASVH